MLSEMLFSRTGCKLCSAGCARSPLLLLSPAEPVINLAHTPEKVLGLKVCASTTGDPAAGAITGESASLEDKELGA